MSGLPLKRGIAIVVSIKVLIVLSAAFWLFSPRQRPHIDDTTVRDRLLDNSVSSTGRVPK